MTARDARFISPQRRISEVCGGGVQYIPGHVEPFVDGVIELLRVSGDRAEILEIGGGGLRFATAATAIKVVTTLSVVEPDYASLGPDQALAGLPDAEAAKERLRAKCLFYIMSEERFFARLAREVLYDVVASFRVFHFLDEAGWERVISQVATHLRPGGLFIFSGLSPVDQDSGEEAPLYRGSLPVGDDPDYRELDTASEPVAQAMALQNLPGRMRFFPADSTIARLNAVGFSLVYGPMRSTRMVHGFVFRKN